MTILRYLKLTCCALICSAVMITIGCSAVTKSDTNQATQLYDSGDITVYRFDGGTVGVGSYDDEWYNEFLLYYQKEYGGTVTPVLVRWQGWEKRFNTDLASGVAPDLIYLFENNYYKLLKRDLLVSVEEMKENGVTGTDHPSLLLKQRLASDRYSANGKNYAFACAYAEADMIFVNEDLFSQYGVTSPYEYYTNGKWNTDALIECAQAITQDSDNNGKNDIFGYYGYDPYAFVASAGGELVKLESKGKVTSKAADKKTLKGLANYHELYSGGYATNYYSNWLSGKVAMVGWLPNSEYANLISERLDFNWSVVPFPLDKENTDGVRSGRCYGWAVTSSSVNWQSCVNYVVALNKYGVINPDATQPEYSSLFNTDQLQMFSDCAENIQLPLYNGVGDLKNTQWDMWGMLSDAKYTYQQSVNMIQKEIDKQIKSEK